MKNSEIVFYKHTSITSFLSSNMGKIFGLMTTELIENYKQIYI
jgi:hypothetical protein